jgi:hypothetical protein
MRPRPMLIVAIIALLFTMGCPHTDPDDDANDDDQTEPDDDTSDDDSAADDDDSAADDDDSGTPGDHDGDGWTIFDGDCDDWNPEVNPGAAEIPCDDLDNDCDGQGGSLAMALVGDAEHATFADAITVAQDGDTIRICPGTWFEQIEVADD